VAGRRPRYARQDQGKRQVAILEILEAVDFVIEKDFPARGTVELASSASG